MVGPWSSVCTAVGRASSSTIQKSLVTCSSNVCIGSVVTRRQARRNQRYSGAIPGSSTHVTCLVKLLTHVCFCHRAVFVSVKERWCSTVGKVTPWAQWKVMTWQLAAQGRNQKFTWGLFFPVPSVPFLPFPIPSFFISFSPASKCPLVSS